MKSRTSFFKPITLKKDILRFAPVWALYLIGMLLVLLESGNYYDYDNYASMMMPSLITAFGVVNLCYAGLCANLLFGDLYNTKLCYSLHAMPYRRESWLLTHLVSGLLFSLVPNAIASLYMMWRLHTYWFLGLYWLLATTLQFLFFFGIATVSAMLTGNRFAMLAVYAGFNFVAMLLYATIFVIYIPMLTGVVANLTDFAFFSPVVQLFRHDYFTFTRENVLSSNFYSESKFFYRYDGLADGWGYTAILGCVGLAAVGIALWLYRKRHLESAGDFVAFPRLKGVACVIITLCVALCFALLGEAMGSGYILWLAVGLTVGYFGSLMLLERRLKVFRKNTFLGFGALAIAVTISLFAVQMDWFGIESWTPNAQQVKSVQVSNNSNYGYDYIGRLSVTLEDPEDIARIIDAHEDILGRLDEMNVNGNDRHRVTLVYKLKSGRTVVRSYYAPASGANYDIIRSYLYKTESVLGYSEPMAAAKNITYFYCDKGPVPQVLYTKLLEALREDFAGGAIGPDKDGQHYVEYGLSDGDTDVEHRFFNISEEAENTMALLKSPEMLMGYGKWDALLAGIENLNVTGPERSDLIPMEQWAALLEALRKDIEAGNVDLSKWGSGEICLSYEHRMEGGEYAYREFYISEKAQNVQAWLLENFYTPAG